MIAMNLDKENPKLLTNYDNDNGLSWFLRFELYVMFIIYIYIPALFLTREVFTLV